MQKILITGANGFIGQNLVQKLLLKKNIIIATGKGASRLPFDTAQFVFESMDFTDEVSVEEVFQKHRPDVVVHCGAWSKPDDCELNREEAYKVNVTGTIHLLKKAAQLRSFFIFLSTDFIFDGVQNIYREESAADPVNYYGQTKFLAEEEVKKYPYDWSIVRPILVYGKCLKGRHNIVSMVAEALQEGRVISIVDDQVRTPTYVEDLVDGIISIIEKRCTGIFHLSGEEVLTPFRMACAVARYLEKDESLVKRVTADNFQQPAKRPGRTIFDLSKAKRELAYQPVTFEEGLRRTLGMTSGGEDR
ncbi:SDR family oxidoreductase [Chitinophagaceae bacterium LB-8]|uniref:dTDP-4-dehydrorhamnose reductase n=1 Tax=Paraflavisolibacter caeni TaxID=2982496 RepID=A0A9X2XSS1_9BACT|nr:SDR family oxidoreductase [Paraflavisolibacter caeni]MCU7548246.1 SDR family oxidoreductase [Paraflavisolibacter caeni]